MYLKEKNPNIQVIGIDVYGSLLKKYKETGQIDMSEVYPYITEGIGEDFVPENYDMNLIDHIEQVTDKDGALMARRLAREEGLFCGYSAGTVMQGIMQVKEKFKPGDLAVVILHDHGSRYVAKIYNDDWMRERGFLVDEPITAKTLIESKQFKQLIGVDSEASIIEAFELMKSNGLSQIPVMKEADVIGSINEHSLLKVFMEDKIGRNGKVKDVMQHAFPEVSLSATATDISKLINKDNSAVLVRDTAGYLHIITEYDLIEAMAH